MFKVSKNLAPSAPDAEEVPPKPKVQRFVAIDNKTREQIVTMRAQGLPQKDIARACGVTIATVSRTLAKAARHAVASLGVRAFVSPVTNVPARLQEEAGPSLERVVRLRDTSEKDEVQLRAAMDLLDRAGYKPIERSIHVHAIESMTAEELRDSFMTLMDRVVSRNTQTVLAITQEGEKEGERKKAEASSETP